MLLLNFYLSYHRLGPSQSQGFGTKHTVYDQPLCLLEENCTSVLLFK